tara:strand:+ start:555 stop:659 length:105 start_codon:yes stop_codon:yes gene_type:complete
MDGTYYRVEFCPFCGDKVDEELEDEIEDMDEYED